MKRTKVKKSKDSYVPSNATKLWAVEERKLAFALLNKLQHSDVTTFDKSFWDELVEQFKQDENIRNPKPETHQLRHAFLYILKNCSSNTRKAKLLCVKEFISTRKFETITCENESEDSLLSTVDKMVVDEPEVPNQDFGENQVVDFNQQMRTGVFVLSTNIRPEKKDRVKFLFINYTENDSCKVIKRAAEDLVRAHGGVMIEEHHIDKRQNLDTYVINFGLKNELVTNFLKCHQHDIYCPSLIFAAVASNVFVPDECHIFMDRLRFVLEEKCSTGKDAEHLGKLAENKVFPTIDWHHQNAWTESEEVTVPMEHCVIKVKAASTQFPECAESPGEVNDAVTQTIEQTDPDQHSIEKSVFGIINKITCMDNQLLKAQEMTKCSLTAETRTLWAILKMAVLFRENENNWKERISIQKIVFDSFVQKPFKDSNDLKVNVSRYIKQAGSLENLEKKLGLEVSPEFLSFLQMLND